MNRSPIAVLLKALFVFSNQHDDILSVSWSSKPIIGASEVEVLRIDSFGEVNLTIFWLTLWPRIREQVCPKTDALKEQKTAVIKINFFIGFFF